MRRISLPRLWDAVHGVLLANASSLMATTVATAGLGYLYWTLAARQFPPAAVGLASASISAMLLLGNIGILGLGTLLMAELPRRPGQARSLLTSAVITAAAVSGGIGVVFAILAPYVSPDFRPLAAGVAPVVLFAVGVSATAAGYVLDQVLMGLLRGHLLFGRNVLFAAAKLGALFVVGLAVTGQVGLTSGLTIYGTWLAGNVVSLVALALLAGRRGGLRDYWPQWGLLRGLGRAALGHHALNLALQGPLLALPVLVTALLSATVNAYFYISFMIVGFVYVIPAALTFAVYAVGARDPQALARKIRFTCFVSVVLGTLANGVLWLGAPLALSFFGRAYAEEATWALRVLGLGVYPLIVRDHFVAISRVHSRVRRAAAVVAVGGGIELVGAGIGAATGGLTGLTLGWLLASCIEAAVMAPTVYRTVVAPDGRESPPADVVGTPPAERHPEWRAA